MIFIGLYLTIHLIELKYNNNYTITHKSKTTVENNRDSIVYWINQNKCNRDTLEIIRREHNNLKKDMIKICNNEIRKRKLNQR